MTQPAAQTFSPKQLHERWNFHEESVRRMIRDGRLPAMRIGKRLRVARSDVESFETASRLARYRDLKAAPPPPPNE